MKGHRNLLVCVLGSRKPFVSVRVDRRDGSVKAEILAERRYGKATELKALVERIFQAEDRLTKQEWGYLFDRPSLQTVTALWPLLVRLAVWPKDGEGKFRDRLIALPAGTAVSMRLLLLEGRGGNRKEPTGQAVAAGTGLPFSKLPKVVKLLLLKEALRKEQKDNRFRLDEEFGALLAEVASKHGLRLDVQPRDPDRLRAALVRNKGKFLFPSRTERASQSSPADALSKGRKGTA